MTTRGSGASYIVTSICKVIAATSTVSTVYIDSENSDKHSKMSSWNVLNVGIIIKTV